MQGLGRRALVRETSWSMRGAPDGCEVSEDLACPVVCMDGPLTLELPCVEQDLQFGHKVRDRSGKRHLTNSKGPAACDIPGIAWPVGAAGARTLCNMVWTTTFGPRSAS
eukprot:8946420-Pyramimonas_sp.AAC.3